MQCPPGARAACGHACWAGGSRPPQSRPEACAPSASLPAPPSRPPRFLSPPPPPPTPRKEPQHCEHTQQVTHIPPGLKATFPVVLTGRQPEARATSPGSHAVGMHLPHHGRDDPRPSRQLAESRLAARARLSVFR